MIRAQTTQVAPLRQLWLTRLSIIWGWLALTSSFLFFGALVPSVGSAANKVVMHLMVYMPVPGLLFGILAILTGVIAYKRERVRSVLWGVISGAFIFAIFLYFLAIRGGTPFLCISDNACGNGCYSYAGDTKADILHPGTCFHYFHGAIILGNDVYTGQ